MVEDEMDKIGRNVYGRNVHGQIFVVCKQRWRPKKIVLKKNYAAFANNLDKSEISQSFFAIKHEISLLEACFGWVNFSTSYKTDNLCGFQVVGTGRIVSRIEDFEDDIPILFLRGLIHRKYRDQRKGSRIAEFRRFRFRGWRISLYTCGNKLGTVYVSTHKL